MEVQNRYAEAVPYATRAASPKYEFAALSAELLGRMRLALGQYGEANKAFDMAAASNLGSAKVWKASSLAAEQRFDEAEKRWPRLNELEYGYFDRVSIYLDQGKWDLAIAEARRVAATTAPGTSRYREGFYPLAVAQWARGDSRASQATLKTAAALALASMKSPNSSMGAREDASLAAYVALLSQRMGDDSLAAEVSRRVRGQGKLASHPPVDSLLSILDARQALRRQDPAGAIDLLLPVTDGSELFQVRVALQEAYTAAGQPEKALVQARWLKANRGRAYSEFGGCKWCQQPLNVVDARLADLRVAELLAGQSRAAEAKRELELFDRYWPASVLPDQPRLRRTVLEGTFK